VNCENKKTFSPLEAHVVAVQLAQSDQGYKIKRGLKYCETCKGYHIEVIKN